MLVALLGSSAHPGHNLILFYCLIVSIRLRRCWLHWRSVSRITSTVPNSRESGKDDKTFSAPLYLVTTPTVLCRICSAGFRRQSPRRLDCRGIGIRKCRWTRAQPSRYIPYNSTHCAVDGNGHDPPFKLVWSFTGNWAD